MKRAWFRNAERIRVDEKIDGSQISFGIAPEGEVRTAQGKQAPENEFLTKPTLWIRSRSRFLDLENPDKMFAAAVESIRAREKLLRPGYTYMGEYLNRPKHNVLAYERVPEGNIVLFDVAVLWEGDDLQCWIFMSLEELQAHAEIVELECVQSADLPFNGTLPGADYFKASMLGGIPEGVVVKAWTEKERVIAKIVSEQFKEVKGDRTSRTQANPQDELPIRFANRFCPPARFVKAVQRMKENGEWNEAMSDIPRLRQLVTEDLVGECGEQMRDELFEMFRRKIIGASLQPLAAWYEQYLTNDNAFWSAYRDE